MPEDDDQMAPGRRSSVSRRSLLAGTAAATAAGIAASSSSPATAAGSGATTATGSPQLRSALVTGSSRGIGAATAGRLGRDGYSVTVNYLNSRDQGLAVVRDIESVGGRAILVQADVSDPAAVRGLFDAHEEAFGAGLDVVVSNAGIFNVAPFSEFDDATFDRLIAVNIKGSFNTLREGSRRIRDGGRIIALSSSVQDLAPAEYGPYAATKVAQDMFAAALSKELAGRQVSVVPLAPGVVNTPLFTADKTQAEIEAFIARTPHGRLMEPSDIADVIGALCSPDGFWVSGYPVFANGGLF